METLTRCATCGASVPPGAAWCSLCHTDLRPRPAAPAEPVVTVGGAVTVAPAPAGSGRDEADDLDEAPAPRGRHSRVEEDEPAPAPRSRAGRHGAHATGRRARPEPSARRSALDLEPVAELGADATPADVDRVADALLSRLAVAEHRSSLLDPDDLPGGKWGFAAAAAMVFGIVVFAVLSIAGFVLSR